MRNKRNVLIIIGALSFLLAIVLFSSFKLYFEVSRLNNEYQKLQGKIETQKVKLKEAQAIFNDLINDNWELVSREKVEDKFNNWLLDNKIILTQDKTSSAGKKQIKFTNNLEVIWQEFIPMFSYLINYFQETELQIKSEADGEKVIINYIPINSSEIFLNRKLLGEFKNRSANITIPKSGITPEAKKIEINDISEKAKVNHGKNLISKDRTIYPLPDYIKVLGYINKDQNAHFLLSISGKKVLLDTFSEKNEGRIIKDEKNYNLEYKNNLYFLRRRD